MIYGKHGDRDGSELTENVSPPVVVFVFSLPPDNPNPPETPRRRTYQTALYLLRSRRPRARVRNRRHYLSVVVFSVDPLCLFRTDTLGNYIFLRRKTYVRAYTQHFLLVRSFPLSPSPHRSTHAHRSSTISIYTAVTRRSSVQNVIALSDLIVSYSF